MSASRSDDLMPRRRPHGRGLAVAWRVSLALVWHAGIGAFWSTVGRRAGGRAHERPDATASTRGDVSDSIRWTRPRDAGRRVGDAPTRRKRWTQVAPAVPAEPGAPLPTGMIERTRPGAPWWRYRRPEPSMPRDHGGREDAGEPPGARGRATVDGIGRGRGGDGRGDDGRGGEGGGDAGDPGVPEPEAVGTGIEGAPVPPSGLVPGTFAALLVGTALLAGRFEASAASRFLLPIAAVLAAVAIGKRLARLRPDEPWLGRFLVAAVIFKLVATYLRYVTFEGGGDAIHYDRTGRQLAAAWFGSGTAPEFDNLRKTNSVKWFTGVVYETFGPDMITGFIVFGLLAFVGTYLWYRATVTAVPFVDRRLYLALVLFAPSMAFWPASIGKESLMQLGFGLAALGTAHLMHHRLLRGLLIAAPGGWVMWVVRPHVLAMATIAAGLAYLLGQRTTTGGAPRRASLSRPIGAVVLAFLVSFAVSAGADSLGIEELSIQGIEEELDATTEQTTAGGSRFDGGGNSLSPLTLPEGMATVLLRPFPWEVETGFQILASIESMALAGFIIYRRRSLMLSLTRARSTPFLLYCWVLVLIYAATFSSFGNFGLLVRQRSLVLPALLVLLSLDVVHSRARRDVEQPTPGSSQPGKPSHGGGRRSRDPGGESHQPAPRA